MTKSMRFTTPLRPRTGGHRRPADVRQWLAHRAAWLGRLDPMQLFHRLFDHIPGVYFFAKDHDGHIMFASQPLLERYHMCDEAQIVGLNDFDINPNSMAEAFVGDDRRILSGEVAFVERLELWWDAQGMPDWFVVTKMAVRDRFNMAQGVMGVLRPPDSNERALPIFQTVARAVELMRRDYAKPLRIDQVASDSGQSLRQLQRHFQSVFGFSPQEFLIKTRINAAARLLEETVLSASEIAHQCGFVDPSSFTQLFRKRMRVTPGGYRKKLESAPRVY